MVANGSLKRQRKNSNDPARFVNRDQKSMVPPPPFTSIRPAIFITKEALINQDFFLMRKMGLEPTQLESYKILSLARLPVPTLPHRHLKLSEEYITIPTRKCQQKNIIFSINFFTLSKPSSGLPSPAQHMPFYIPESLLLPVLCKHL